MGSIEPSGETRDEADCTDGQRAIRRSRQRDEADIDALEGA